MSQEKEYFARFPKLMVPSPIWAVVFGLILAVALYAGKALSSPRFVATDGTTSITLHDEPCELKEVVTNLPYKATWTENGKSFEGCWGSWVNDQRVLAYFTDKTVALIPFNALAKVQGV